MCYTGITNKIVFEGMNHLTPGEVRLKGSPSKHRHCNGAPRPTCSSQDLWQLLREPKASDLFWGSQVSPCYHPHLFLGKVLLVNDT